MRQTVLELSTKAYPIKGKGFEIATVASICPKNVGYSFIMLNYYIFYLDKS